MLFENIMFCVLKNREQKIIFFYYQTYFLDFLFFFKKNHF